MFKGENSADVILWNVHLTLCAFKLGILLNTIRLYSLIPVWMTLMFTDDHRVTGQLELVQSFCCKVAWSDSDVRDYWLKEMTVKKSCKYGKYGLFEHLLFVFFFQSVSLSLSLGLILHVVFAFILPDSPFRVSLHKSDSTDYCVLLDHIPHNNHGAVSSNCEQQVNCQQDHRLMLN